MGDPGSLEDENAISATSGLSTLNKYQIAERGARMTRRVDREYREYLREAQRRQTRCPACEVVFDRRGQTTSRGSAGGTRTSSPYRTRSRPRACRPSDP